MYTFDSRQLSSDVWSYRLLTSTAIKVSAWILTGMVALFILLSLLLESKEGVWSGAALIALGLAGGTWLLYSFGATYFPYRPIRKTISDLEKMPVPQQSAINAALAASWELVVWLQPFTTPPTNESLVQGLAALRRSPLFRRILKRLQLDPASVETVLHDQVLPQVSWESITSAMIQYGTSLGDEYLPPEALVAAWLLHPALKTPLRSWGLQEKDVWFVIWWQYVERKTISYKARWWLPEHMLSFTGVGLSWTSGYTPLVDQLSHFPRGNLWDELPLGRESEIEQVINGLARARQSNVLLVGHAGAGRLGIVKEINRRLQAGHVHPAIVGERMVYLHVAELLARATSSAGQLTAISQILREMERGGNIIVVLDGLGSILGEEGEERVNMTEALLPFLSSLTVRVIAIVSNEEYHLRLIHNTELIHWFEVVQVPALSEDSTLQLLALTARSLEKESGVYLPYSTLQVAVTGTASILPHIPFPERAFDFIAEAIVLAQGRNETVLKPEHIQYLISQKVGVNVGAIGGDERQRLLSLEDLMHTRVVNQEVAITAVVRAMLRARAGIRSLNRPIGTFLFLGPTGVGKTETAKTLAEAYFGSQDHLLRLDMSEFLGDDAIAQLIGSSRHPAGRLTSMIAEHPFAVLLLDEFEKAPPQVHQLFLPIFDEGYITDARGQTISFKHVIIIVTSNAGAEFIRQQVSRGPLPTDFADQLRDHILEHGIFKPELVNRFDGVITFTPLSTEHIRQVAQLMLKNLNRRLDAEHGITVAITPELISFLVSIGYNPEFGARPMARAIQDTVEYSIASQIVRGQVQPGSQVVLSPEILQQVKTSR